jgi:Tfp pilus assembly protein PilO
MKFSENSGKNNLNFLSAIIIVVAVIVAYNIFKNQNQQIDKLKSQAETETKKNVVLKEISQIEKKIASYKVLLARKDASSVMNNLQNMARESGAKIESIRPSTEQRLAEYIKVPFSLSVRVPNYHALGRFISKVEGSKDVYMVENVDIRTDTQTKELVVSLTVNSITIANQ